MKVLGILGSPRVGGNSDIRLEQALAGARDAGAEVEKITRLRRQHCVSTRKSGKHGNAT